MLTEQKKIAPLKIVFMGTPQFAAAHLEALIKDSQNFRIEAVYSRPDKPKGRSNTPVPSEVKEMAQKYLLNIVQISNFKDESNIRQLESFAPDIIVIVAFGMILPLSVLAIPRYGAINIHASLLPKYRGASPIQQCLMEGESVTGVTSFLLDPGIDTGNILLQKETSVSIEDDYFSLTDKLCRLGIDCLLETLFHIRESNFFFRGHPQDRPDAHYAGKITKEMALLDFSKPAIKLHNRVRALNNWPVCTMFADVEGGSVELKIYKTMPVNPCLMCEGKKSGAISVYNNKILHVKTGEGCLNILEVQMQGKKRMPVQAFLNGHQIQS